MWLTFFIAVEVHFLFAKNIEMLRNVFIICHSVLLVIYK